MTTLRWQLMQVGDEQHVTPLNDLRPHVDAQDCWCKPQHPEDAEPGMWAHNSMDRREEHERGKKEH